MSFCNRLRYAMTERQFTHSSLCAATGIKKSTMSMYLAGHINPSREVKEKLAEALEVTVPWLEEREMPDVVVNYNFNGYSNVPIAVAAKVLGKGQAFIRMALQQGRAPFGFAVKSKSPGNSWSYHISARKLQEYIGGEIDEN